jgi:hypothetical protein
MEHDVFPNLLSEKRLAQDRCDTHTIICFLSDEKMDVRKITLSE